MCVSARTLNRKMFETQSDYGRFGEERILFSLPRIEPLFFSCAACSLVTLPTALSRLSGDAKSASEVTYYIFFQDVGL